jgi:Ca-activated chloride channel family protein
MTSQFGPGSQYDAAMEAITDFTGRRKGDAFGLTIFGNEVLRWVPLTRDLSALRLAAPFVRPENLPRHFSGTEIGKALLHCRQTLIRQEEGDRLIILLSDGRSADLGEARSRRIGRDLAADRIIVYCIHIGHGGPPADLYTVAAATDGRVFEVSDPQGLQVVFAHIDSMQPARLKPRGTLAVDDFGPYALAGMALLAGYVLSLWGLRYTPW